MSSGARVEEPLADSRRWSELTNLPPQSENDGPSRTRAALLWSGVEVAGLQLVQFVLGVCLARLLLPSDFGLIGMLVIFLTLSESFVDGGFGKALIRKQEPTESDWSSVFFLQLVLAVLFALLLGCAAPWIAKFYSEPVLGVIAGVLAVNLVVEASSAVHRFQLTRELRFNTIAKINVLSTAISGAIGIAFAVGGFGVWSLVWQRLSSSTLRTVLLWLCCRWRPRLVFSFNAIRELSGFSVHVFASYVTIKLLDNIPLVVIGKWYSSNSLGFFSRARSLQQLPVTGIERVVNRVAFPVASAASEETLVAGLRNSFSLLSFVFFPAILWLMATSESLVPTLLTSRWSAVIPLLQLLCIAAIPMPFQQLSRSVLLARGNSRLFMFLTIGEKLVACLVLALTFQLGLREIIAGQIVVSIGSAAVTAIHLSRRLGYAISKQLEDTSPYLFAAGLGALAAFLVGEAFDRASPVALVSQTGAIIATYFATCYLCRFSALAESIGHVRRVCLNRASSLT